MNRFGYPLPEIEEVEILLEDLLDEEAFDLVVFNDDVNTFEHVINVLIKVCKHSPEQAEQCTLIIHYKGKCSVKKGSRSELKPLCEAILEEGIQAAIV
ncbi:ATP-dependent Clp protease adaptor protein ClpS [Algoriphagus boseongensis]|uniref:ATP-dependent Clp protease adaptor protein ClpS n=1 Tax=Algoriphagus boseongensis TaxID=1442587 RepID=A0A4R6T4W3_9BACT|nr:ATP-dependent Clp protease adaptor ClpS [Algoriphagus boseongensis]TDQ17551.1 ATP-dependent Clp protease adaptor protein ClpS [Algoriphagus boseongensis]